MVVSAESLGMNVYSGQYCKYTYTFLDIDNIVYTLPTVCPSPQPTIQCPF